MLDERWESVKTIQGTHRLHFFKPVSRYILSVKCVSDGKLSTMTRISDDHTAEEEESMKVKLDSRQVTIKCGDFVDILLMSDTGKQQKYRGLVIERKNDSLQLKYLKKSGKAWIYSDEISWESQCQVVCK